MQQGISRSRRVVDVPFNLKSEEELMQQELHEDNLELASFFFGEEEGDEWYDDSPMSPPAERESFFFDDEFRESLFDEFDELFDRLGEGSGQQPPMVLSGEYQPPEDWRFWNNVP